MKDREMYFPIPVNSRTLCYVSKQAAGRFEKPSLYHVHHDNPKKLYFDTFNYLEDKSPGSNLWNHASSYPPPSAGKFPRSPLTMHTKKPNPFEQWTKTSQPAAVDSSSNLERVIDLGENVRTKYFSNKIRLDSHRDLVRMAKLEQRQLATILENALACYKKHQHPHLD